MVTVMSVMMRCWQEPLTSTVCMLSGTLLLCRKITERETERERAEHTGGHVKVKYSLRNCGV